MASLTCSAFLKSSGGCRVYSSSSTSFLFHQRSCLLPPSSYSTWFHNFSGNANALCSRSQSDSMYHSTAVQSPVGFSNDDNDVFADEKQVRIPSASSSLPPHWELCQTILQNVSINFALTIPLINDTHLRHAVCIFYLLIRALDTVEDDTSITTDIRVPILNAFHRHIYDPTLHFPCGTRQHDIVLMNEFRYLSNAFLELEKSYQEVIEDLLKRMGAGVAKFICNEVETVDDYEEYCDIVTGLYMICISKLFHISCSEDCIVPPDTLANSIGLFYQKTHIIKDYMDDINEIPKPRMFWPREIWSKYVANLHDLKEEENLVKAVQCLNEMVTNALIHAEDSLLFLSSWKDPSMFRFHATLQITTMGNLALFYDNIEVFRGPLAISPGLIDRISTETESMVDVYGAFFDFSCILKSKVNKNDPNATLTLSRLDAIQKACTDSGLLHTKRKLYVV